MSEIVNTLARFQGSPIQHRLVVGTKTTVCGKDATLAHRYPTLTRSNSTDRLYRTCSKCD